jgi:hypothetical protein
MDQSSEKLRPPDSANFQAEPPASERTRINEGELHRAMYFLAVALKIASAYDPSRPDHGRASVGMALTGVIHLIAVLFPNQPVLPASLNDLLYALRDLDHGRVALLLEPAKVDHNPGTPLRDELFRAFAAAAMTRLMEVMKLDEAARLVARQLFALGYRSAKGEYKASQVEKWREKVRTERAAEHLGARHYQAVLTQVEPLEARVAAEFLFDCMTTLYPPSFSKPSE